MNMSNIRATLTSRGITVQFKWSRAGTVAGVPVGGNQYICSLIPIDDDHDMRFCDALESNVKAFRSGTFKPTTTRKEIEGF